MKYVIDSSVAVKTVLTEIDSGKALRLIDEFRAGLHDLFASEVFHIEIAHALTKAERQLKITPPQGWIGWKSIMADCPLLVASLPLMPRAFDISSSMRVGVYDCLYVALAERELCEFVTADDKLIKNLQPKFPSIIALSSMP
jgi:predicted nucleic acid-binding protein